MYIYMYVKHFLKFYIFFKGFLNSNYLKQFFGLYRKVLSNGFH